MGNSFGSHFEQESSLSYTERIAVEFDDEEKAGRLYFWGLGACDFGLSALCIRNCRIWVFQGIHYCMPG